MLAHPIAVRGFGLDHAAMEWADATVMVLPCGKSAHLELGWACGRGKLAFVLYDGPDEPELTYRETYERGGGIVVDLDELIAALASATVQPDHVARIAALEAERDGGRVEGARLALERAANLVEEHAARAHRAANAYGDEDATALMTERRERAIAYEQAAQMIRALDPAAVAKGGAS